MKRRSFISKLAGGLLAAANGGLVALRLKRRPPQVRFFVPTPQKLQWPCNQQGLRAQLKACESVYALEPKPKPLNLHEMFADLYAIKKAREALKDSDRMEFLVHPDVDPEMIRKYWEDTYRDET